MDDLLEALREELTGIDPDTAEHALQDLAAMVQLTGPAAFWWDD